MAPPRPRKLRIRPPPRMRHSSFDLDFSFSGSLKILQHIPVLRLLVPRPHSDCPSPLASHKAGLVLARSELINCLHSTLVVTIIVLSLVLLLNHCKAGGPPSSSGTPDPKLLALLTGSKSPADVASPAGTPVNESTVIPGSRLSTVEEVEKFRRQLDCIASQGKWEEDPTPRLLPWPYDEGNFGHCDGRWTWTAGHISHKAADDVVRNRAPASEWVVRPNLKFEWRTDKDKCGPDAGMTPWSSSEMSRVLTDDSAKPEPSTLNPSSPASERVIMMVGDSMQHAYAISLYDNMRMGLDETAAKEEVVPLVPESLPCFVRGLAHRRMCWGAHFHAKSRPGAKLLFVRNDFLSLVDQATWGRDGKHFQLPWIDTVKALVRADYQWQEGGTMKAPRRRSKNSPPVVEEYHPSPRGAKTLPPVLVLNRGVHFVNDSVFYAELNASMHEARRVCPECLIIFRNTPGGHKNCNSFDLPLKDRPLQEDLPFNWWNVTLQSRHPLTRQIVESVGGVFLDVEWMTGYRADGHTGKNRQGKEDCTHYCAPGPLDTWTRLLLHALQGLLH